MKSGFFFGHWRVGLFSPIVILLLLLGLLPCPTHAADVPHLAVREYQLSPGELDNVGKAVVDLLQSKDAGTFATNMAVSADDVRSLETTNLSSEDLDGLKNFEKGASYNLTRLKDSAKALLDRAGSLHVDFSKGGMKFEIMPPKTIGKMFWTHPTADGTGGMPYIDKLQIVLKSDTLSIPAGAGDFKLTIDGLEKFPTGWRVGNGLQWTAFPTNYIDAKTQRELAVIEKLSSYKGFTGEDDPTLLTAGESLVRFIRSRDLTLYKKELLVDGERSWIDQEVNQAKAAFKMMDDAGVDLKDAGITIKSATVEHGQIRIPGSIDKAVVQQYKLTFTVKTNAKAKNGTPLAGDYVLGVKRLQRFGDAWKVEDDLHWEKFPTGILDDKATETMNFENYVAEHGTLPLQSTAPEIEFTTLADGKKMKLSDFKGKVVIMDFWATWCGPCQGPMADLQKLRDGHDDWGDKVAIIPLSIDDDIGTVRKHVNQRGWTNTFNVWAGDGGWRSTPAQTYRVTGVPTSYVIDQQGHIIWAGHPAGARFAETIDYLLAR